MNINCNWRRLFAVVLPMLAAAAAVGQDDAGGGVKAAWDLNKAYRETTATREKICINGLWRWQPAEKTSDQVPTNNWGYFKGPGCWPGTTIGSPSPGSSG